MQDQAASPAQPEAGVRPFPQADDMPVAMRQESTYSYDSYYREDDVSRAAQLAKALGWFSIGLGVAQLLAPRQLSRAVGVDTNPNLVRALGVREVASGAGILAGSRPSNWLWSRVAGDAMDLALLGMASRSARNQRRLSLATAAVAGIAVLDLLSSMDNAQREKIERGEDTSGVSQVEKSIAVNRSPEECYRFWRDVENFPRFMKNVEEVRDLGDRRIHWKAKGPAGLPVVWNAELYADEPNEYLAWRTLPGADIDHEGIVRFDHAPGGRGTIIRVSMQYRPPGGAAGNMVAKLFGEDPSRQIDENLRRFKWLIETGEIPTTVGQPAGRRGTMNRLLFRKGAPG